MSQPASSIRVPLNVDGQFRLAVGPMLLPVRSVVLAAAVSPFAYALLALRLPGLWSAVGAGFLLATAAAFGLPERQGVWIGTHLLYRHAWRFMPSTVTRGRLGRARVRELEGSVHVTGERTLDRDRRLAPRRWRATMGVPATAADVAGILRLDPGGHRAVLVLEGPAVSVSSDAYLSWCRSAISWVGALGCPVQFLTLMTHHDAGRVGGVHAGGVHPRPAPLPGPVAALRRARRHPSSGHTVARGASPRCQRRPGRTSP